MKGLSLHRRSRFVVAASLIAVVALVFVVASERQPPSRIEDVPTANRATIGVSAGDPGFADSVEPVQDRTRHAGASVAPESESTDPEAGQVEADVVQSAPNTPLERLLQPWREEHIRTNLETIRTPTSDRTRQLDAAMFLMTEYIAIRMEQAGTGIDAPKKGDQRVELPAPQQFFKDGRVYCFHEGEFADWDRLEKLSKQGGGDVESFLASVEGYGEEILAIHEESR